MTLLYPLYNKSLLEHISNNICSCLLQGSENSSCDDGNSERVRFDEHVSFIAPAQEAWLGDTVLDMEHCGIVTEPKRAKRRGADPSDPLPTLPASPTLA